MPGSQQIVCKRIVAQTVCGARLEEVKVYETILEADDLIFVPAGWPHQDGSPDLSSCMFLLHVLLCRPIWKVDNLETSMAISSNFIVCVLNKLSVDDNSHSARLKMWALFKRSANRQLSLAWLLSPHSNLFSSKPG